LVCLAYNELYREIERLRELFRKTPVEGLGNIQKICGKTNILTGTPARVSLDSNTGCFATRLMLLFYTCVCVCMCGCGWVGANVGRKTGGWGEERLIIYWSWLESGFKPQTST